MIFSKMKWLLALQSSVSIEPLKRTRGRPTKSSSALIDDTPIIPIVNTIVKTIKKRKIVPQPRKILKRNC